MFVQSARKAFTPAKSGSATPNTGAEGAKRAAKKMLDVGPMKTMKPVTPVWHDQDGLRKPASTDKRFRVNVKGTGAAAAPARMGISSISVPRSVRRNSSDGHARPVVVRGQIGPNMQLIVEGQVEDDFEFEVEEDVMEA